MKLYYYDHCPFCVRTFMAAHYKQVDIQKVTLLSNDEETPIRLIGAKQAPILEFDDGSAMPESLDIVKKFDEIGNADKIIYPETGDKKAVISHIESMIPSIIALLYPRNIKAGLKEFATQDAIDYYRKKKEPSLKITFEEAFEQTVIHKKNVEYALQTLPPFKKSSENKIGWNDFFIFPILRNLTLVKELQFPQDIKNYIDHMSSISDVELFYKVAL